MTASIPAKASATAPRPTSRLARAVHRRPAPRAGGATMTIQNPCIVVTVHSGEGSWSIPEFLWPA